MCVDFFGGGGGGGRRIGARIGRRVLRLCLFYLDITMTQFKFRREMLGIAVLLLLPVLVGCCKHAIWLATGTVQKDHFNTLFAK
jgi:hypothetical protein